MYIKEAMCNYKCSNFDKNEIMSNVCPTVEVLALCEYHCNVTLQYPNEQYIASSQNATS